MEFYQLGLLGVMLSSVFLYFAIRYFPKLGLLDFPSRYGLKRQPIPYPGGLVLLLLSLGIGCIDVSFLPVMLGTVCIGVVSFYDDRFQLSPQFRLLVQLFVAGFIYYVGIRINFIGNPFSDTNIELWLYWPWISLLMTLLWIMIIQNAMNWFDGIPGLSVGISGVGFLVLGLLGVIRPELFFDLNHTALTMANFYLAGLCLGGLYFFWSKKILLGDTGSQVLGFLLAVMAIFSGAKIATTLLVLLIPLLDFFVVIARRLFLEKKSPLKGDLKHVHHHLSFKMGERLASLILITISFCLGLVAILLTGIWKAIFLFIFVVLVFYFILWLNKGTNR